jgi:hypothetical protein
MVDHATATGHHLVLSFSDLSVWCYACEDYIGNKVISTFNTNTPYKHMCLSCILISHTPHPVINLIFTALY